MKIKEKWSQVFSQSMETKMKSYSPFYSQCFLEALDFLKKQLIIENNKKIFKVLPNKVIEAFGENEI